MTCRDAPEPRRDKRDGGSRWLSPCPAPFQSKKPQELGTSQARAALQLEALRLLPLASHPFLAGISENTASKRGHLQHRPTLKAPHATHAEKQHLWALSQPSPISGV